MTTLCWFLFSLVSIIAVYSIREHKKLIALYDKQNDVIVRYTEACRWTASMIARPYDLDCYAQRIVNDDMKNWQQLTGKDPLVIENFRQFLNDMNSMKRCFAKEHQFKKFVTATSYFTRCRICGVKKDESILEVTKEITHHRDLPKPDVINIPPEYYGYEKRYKNGFAKVNQCRACFTIGLHEDFHTGNCCRFCGGLVLPAGAARWVPPVIENSVLLAHGYWEFADHQRVEKDVTPGSTMSNTNLLRH